MRREIREGAQLKAGDFWLGRFKLIERIGHGGFANIWKAMQEGKVLTQLLQTIGQVAPHLTRK